MQLGLHGSCGHFQQASDFAVGITLDVVEDEDRETKNHKPLSYYNRMLDLEAGGSQPGPDRLRRIGP